jgi:hypothetical protein
MPKPGPAQVYRFFNQDGLVLYAGITQDFAKRWANHAATQIWWDQVRRSTVDFYPNWPAASEIEGVSIAIDRPAYNVAQAPPAILYAIELTRMFADGEVPRDNEAVTRMLWDLARALATHLRRLTEKTSGPRRWSGESLKPGSNPDLTGPSPGSERSDH